MTEEFNNWMNKKVLYKKERQDSEEIRQEILSISYSEWKNMGFSKGTLDYMKTNAEADKPFTLNSHVRERLEMWETSFIENDI